MGFFHNTKDIQKALWLFVRHRCSACGQEQATKQKVVIRYCYDEIALSRSESERGAAAREQLEKIEEGLLERIKDPADTGVLYDLNLLGKCKKCGNKEAWSRMRIPGFETVFNVLVTMSVLGTAAGLVSAIMSGEWIMLAAAAGIIALTACVKALETARRKKKEKAILALGEDAPFLTADAETFKEKFPDIDPEKLEKIEPASGYRLKFM